MNLRQLEWLHSLWGDYEWVTARHHIVDNPGVMRGEWKRLWKDDLADFVMYGSSSCAPFNTKPIVIKNGGSIELLQECETEIDCSFMDELL